MKTLRAALFTLLLATGHAIAQDQDTVTGEQYHPYLTDKWMIGIGGFWPKKDLTVSVFASIRFFGLHIGTRLLHGFVEAR